MTTRDTNPVGLPTADETLSRIRAELETYEQGKHPESKVSPRQTNPNGALTEPTVTQTGVDSKGPFGSRLRQAREARGMSQKDLAEALNTHVNSVSRYERNERAMDSDMVARACVVLGCDPRWLLLGEGQPPPVMIDDTVPNPPAQGP